VALEAGTVGWDGELFSGQPDWRVLMDNRNPGLTDEEQSFVDIECGAVAGMCNAWDIAHERADLPADAWNYLKKKGSSG